MAATTARSHKTAETHLIWGETPGWAYCNEWIQTGEQMPADTHMDCRRCAAMDTR
ncbi:hypothetical protein [Nocardiopsis dassonvillei]|uniref:hypothetical protein n=1 Tax=Nocardiopsis dassonvillei TaxID=2014 RepID=UPI00157CE75D|nr:hypothetical protein [Nocardiopsis dassonvillei]